MLGLNDLKNANDRAAEREASKREAELRIQESILKVPQADVKNWDTKKVSARVRNLKSVNASRIDIEADNKPNFTPYRLDGTPWQ